jgi:lipopolysaccharide transport system ATP-binding protein
LNHIAIKCSNLCKTYKIGVKPHNTLRDLISNLLKSKALKEQFFALSDLNFEVEKGDVVGIIGKNGSGKSTLLKILSQITKPTSGRVEINGRVASLLEVGTGFHPELTGRENIYLNGTILGMTRREVKDKFDEIVTFSGVEKFIDTPVKHYSSGMYVRLAFAVAAHLEPEILIIDEVLAVGDAEFQKKCLGKMKDVAEHGRTVLFVSHNLLAVQTLCNRGIYLKNGTIIAEGKLSEVINEYNSEAKFISKLEWRNEVLNQKPLEFEAISVLLREKGREKKLLLSAILNATTNFPKSFVAFYISSEDSIPIIESIPESNPFISSTTARKISLEFEIELNGLIPNKYKIGVWVGSSHNLTLDFKKEIIEFEILESPQEERVVAYPKHAGFFSVKSVLKSIKY